MGERTSRNSLSSLEQQHHELKGMVRVLERRAFLTPTEQHHMTELKKQKLAAKDQIALLKR
ncbi:MAG: YdcH family protein [Myxococcales bacterium]|nr:YdcH family protein [Myxococcales bacterium]